MKDQYDRPTSYVPKDHPLHDAAPVMRKKELTARVTVSEAPKENLTVIVTVQPMCQNCQRNLAVDGEILCKRCLDKL